MTWSVTKKSLFMSISGALASFHLWTKNICAHASGRECSSSFGLQDSWDTNVCSRRRAAVNKYIHEVWLYFCTTAQAETSVLDSDRWPDTQTNTKQNTKVPRHCSRSGDVTGESRQAKLECCDEWLIWDLFHLRRDFQRAAAFYSDDQVPYDRGNVPRNRASKSMDLGECAQCARTHSTTL